MFRVLQGVEIEVLKVFQASFKIVSEKSQGSVKSVLKAFLEYCKGVSKMF